MIVYAASDLHGNLPNVPRDADLLLLAGDICPDFGLIPNESVNRQANWLDGDFRRWLRDTPCRVVATWGNHDFVGEKRGLVDSLHLPWRLLIDGEASVEGLRIWGTPWVPNLPRWAFHAGLEARVRRAEMIPDWIDILMSHGPPYGIGDCIPGGSKYGNIGDEHAGDSTLNDALKRVKPTFFVCGHIHEAYGLYHVPFPRTSLGYDNECLVVNASAVDEFYVLREHPFTRILI